MYTQLEDEFGDVVGKARRGQEMEVAALADRVGLTAGDIARIEDYELVPAADTIERLAQVLGLHPGKLQASAAQAFFPRDPAGRSIGWGAGGDDGARQRLSDERLHRRLCGHGPCCDHRPRIRRGYNSPAFGRLRADGRTDLADARTPRPHQCPRRGRSRYERASADPQGRLGPNG